MCVTPSGEVWSLNYLMTMVNHNAQRDVSYKLRLGSLLPVIPLAILISYSFLSLEERNYLKQFLSNILEI